jgi:hypothetical protein
MRSFICAILFGIVAFIILVMYDLPAHAQRPTIQLECMDANDVAINIVRKDLFKDAEGNFWVTLRNIGTGDVLVGFFNTPHMKFCVVGQGKTNRES